MILFDAPWVWLLLPLPWLGYRWLPVYREQRRALRVPFTVAFSGRIDSAPGKGLESLPATTLIVRWLIWILLLAAAARPVSLEPPLSTLEPRRDLVLAIDLSESMAERDVIGPDHTRIDRLSAVKAAITTFIHQRASDRIGMVGFGDGAFPLAPPSSDHGTLIQMLDALASGMAGANTAMGDAIGVTLNLLDESQAPEQLLILLTDGNDNRSLLPPLQAAAIAAERGLVIHTIGFGQPGDSVGDGVDTETLARISNATGGQHFLATDPQALAQVYRTIDGLTPENAEVITAQPHRELFWIPALIAVGLSVLQALAGAVPVRSDHGRQQHDDKTRAGHA